MLQFRQFFYTPIVMTTTPPVHLLPFLTHTGSLTALLERLAGQALTVSVLSERCRPLTFAEKKQLGLIVSRPILAWERQVLLFGSDKEAWVQANSIFPLSTLIGQGKRFKHLKRTPIGYLLFKKVGTQTKKREIFYDELNFGRSTVYEYQEKPLLIQEIFLQALSDKIGE